MSGLVFGMRRLFHRWLGRPGSDWILVAMVVVTHLSWVRATGSGDLLGTPDREQRLQIYTTGATVVAIAGSFITAAIAQYAAASGRRMRILRTTGHLGSQFRRNWVSILSATLSIAAACLLAMVLDTASRDPGGVQWIVEAALLLGLVRSCRLVWLFNAVILASDRDLAEPPPV